MNLPGSSGQRVVLEADLRLTFLRREPGYPSIVVFPSAGGNAAQYRGLAHHLSLALCREPSVAVLECRSVPGGGVASVHALDARIATSGRLIAARISEPLVLVGHSFGGYLAHQVATAFARRGGQVRALVLLGALPPSCLDVIRPTWTSGPALEKFIAELNGVPDTLRKTELFYEIYLPLIRYELQLFSTAAMRPSCSFDGPTLVVAGAQDSLAPSTVMAEWTGLMGPFRQASVPGGHFFPAEQAPTTAAAIAAFLRERAQIGLDHAETQTIL